MNSKFKVQSSKLRQNFNLKISCKTLLSLFTFHFLLFTFACSIPNLETPECREARQPVKEFYSYHFGNDMKPSRENLQSREKFLSAELFRQLAAQTETATDYFTATADYPKAFRLGRCDTIEANKVVFQILMFWKDDVRSEEREIKVEAVKENGEWLINRILQQ